MMNKLIVFLFLALYGVMALAAGPFVWKQSPEAAPIILPQKDGQTKEEALIEYFRKIHSSESLQVLLEQSEIQSLKVNGELSFKKGKFYELDSAPSHSKTRFIVITNELRELYAPPYGKRSANVKNRLEALGAEVFILPVVHDVTLNIKEAKEFREKLIQLFDAQLVLGGADIDPYLYGEQKTFARGIVRRRDVSELKFVRQFIEAKRGMNFGICRGHQMCAVALHKTLVQDIQIEKGASEVHLNGEHLINVDNGSEVFSVFDQEKILVNSLHHQAVVVGMEDKDYKVIGSSLDHNPIVEALEFKNGKGVTLQFHPEIMHDETGDKILKKFIEITVRNKKNLAVPISCRALVKNFLVN